MDLSNSLIENVPIQVNVTTYPRIMARVDTSRLEIREVYSVNIPLVDPNIHLMPNSPDCHTGSTPIQGAFLLCYRFKSASF